MRPFGRSLELRGATIKSLHSVTGKTPAPLPEKFSSYEEAAEFWDTHDTTDYPQHSRPVKAVSELRERLYQIEIDESMAKILRTAARKKGLTPSRLASDLLRQRLVTRP